jgi:hypothetical protein
MNWRDSGRIALGNEPAESHRRRHRHKPAGVPAGEDRRTVVTTRRRGLLTCARGEHLDGLSSQVKNGRITCMLQRAGLKRR